MVGLELGMPSWQEMNWSVRWLGHETSGEGLVLQLGSRDGNQVDLPDGLSSWQDIPNRPT